MRSLAVGFVLLCACASDSSRAPAAKALFKPEENIGFRVAVREIGDGNRLVLLGVHRPDPRKQFYAYDFRKMGFVGDGIESVEPKFLIGANAKGLQEVYSFDLQFAPSPGLKFNTDGDVVWDRNWGIRYGIWNPMSTQGVPSLLLNMQSSLEDLYLRAAAQLVLQLAKLAPAPFSTVGAALIHLERAGASKAEVEAQYLQYLVTQALDDNALPQLKSAVGVEELRRLGAQLAIRYNREWAFAGLGAPWDELEQLEQYDVIRNVRRGYSSKNLARLVRLSNMQGLVVVPLGPFFAMILAEPDWDLDSSRGNRQYNDRYLEIADSDQAKLQVKKSLQSALRERKLVPFGIFALNQSSAPLQMINFQDPLKWANTERLRKLLSMARDIGYSFLPSAEVSLALSAAGGILKFIARKQGATVFEYRVQASGELQAAFESGLVQIDGRSIVSEAVAGHLQDYGFTENEIRRYRGLIESNDPSQVQRAVDEIVPQLAAREERFGRLLPETPEDQRKRVFSKAIWVARLRNRLADQAAMGRWTRSLGKKGRVLQDEAPPSPPLTAADPQLESFESEAPQRPLIVFLVDGLRPDRLDRAMKSGRAPNLNEWFGRRGVHFESYSPRSITLPSWASALTGHEVDSHGLRSNSPTLREFSEAFNENFIDWRKDVFFPRYWEEGRSYKHIQESGLTWLPRYFKPEEVLLSYKPINDRAYPPLGFLATQAARSLGKFLFDTSDSSVLLDQAQTRKMVQAIQSNARGVRENKRAPLKLVSIWLSSVDHLSHYNSHRIDEAMREVDASVGAILKAASHHPTLKDAFVALVSDHGHIGGPEVADPHRQHSTPSEHYLDNTQLNLVHYFAGSYADRSGYRFNVGAVESPEPDFDLGFLKEFLIQPFRYTFPAKGKPRDLLVDSSGDSVAQIYLKPNSSSSSSLKRASFWDLENYQYRSSVDGQLRSHALLSDLLSMRLKNLESPKLASSIAEQSQGSHPVQFVSLAMPGEAAVDSVKSLGLGELSLSREPILIIRRTTDGKHLKALVLTSDSVMETLFMYVPLQEFRAESDGGFDAKLGSIEDDPAGILRHLQSGGADVTPTWRSERDWIRLLSQHPQPTLLSTFVRSLTLDAPARALPQRQAETPDFLLTANWGFNFNSGTELHSDHGGLFAEETRNTFVLSRIGSRAFSRRYQARGPVLIKDLTPTLLEIAGRKADTGISGQSLKSIAESLVLEMNQRDPASKRAPKPTPMPFEELD